MYWLSGYSTLEHLALESLLLRSWKASNSLLLFYVNKPCLVIGRNQNPWREVSPSSQLPLFRRSSGGGTVYHDEGNLNWALIVPRALHDKDLELESMALAISSLGYDVRPGPRGGLYCGDSSPHPGCKVTGTARRFGVSNVLHHGTLLVQSDLTALQSSLGGIETEEDISLASVSAHPVNITSIGPQSDPGKIAAGIAKALGQPEICPLPPELIDRLLLVQEMELLASEAWVYGATPRFKLKVPTIGGDQFLSVEKGTVVGSGVDPTKDPWIGRTFSFGLYFEIMESAQRALHIRGNMR